MATIKLPDDFKEFLNLLNGVGIRYMIVGGYAVAYYGFPRATKDIDVWVESGAPNIESLARVLKEFGFTDPVLDEWVKSPEKTLRMGYPPVRIEVLTGITGVEFNQAYGRCIEADLDGVVVRLISLEDLKTNKQAAGRHHDLADLENLP